MSRPPLVLEAAGEDDLEPLVELEQRCHSHPWSARNFRDELGDAARGRLIVLRAPFDPADRGRGIVAYCAYQVVAGEMHLLNLAVAPDLRREGLGGILLRLAMEQGARRGAERVYLEVRRSNRAAQGLYERFGFVTTSVRRDYYADPQEDALLLARSTGRPGETTP
ncbi:MAG: ribosomal protein S18-alanine N-acetyltransferase [Solirubrobacterales bacterium]